MPPKASKKAVEKQQKKVVEDKTFGLKNKNKSKKVQNYVQQVAQQAKFQGRSRKDVLDDQKKKEEREAKKIAEKSAEEIGQLFKSVVDTSKMKTALESGVDPKSILCEFFKKGMCKRGAACKYSHDAEAVRKTAKIDLYQDPRELAKDTMDKWDQSKLESVIAEKNKKTGLPPTEIVCKYFIEAIEKKQYGWLWSCPNGELCHYRHALPPGFVLKSQTKNDEKEEDDEIPIEEKIEEERRQLDLSKCTPLTQEVFYKWREEKKKREQEEKEKQRQEEAKKEGSASSKAGFRILSGKDLFRYDPSLFIDDEEADDEKYEIEQKTEADWQQEEEEDEKTRTKDEKTDAQTEVESVQDNDEKIEGAVTVFSEELFLDDEELPEDVNEEDDDETAADEDNDEETASGNEEAEDDEGSSAAASSSSSSS